MFGKKLHIHRLALLLRINVWIIVGGVLWALPCGIVEAQKKDLKESAEIQSQVLETTRKMAESSVEQTRKSAESAVEQTRKIAEQSIQAADRSIHVVETVFTWSVIVFGAVLGLAAFLGMRELKGLREEYARHLQKAVDAEIAKHQGRLQIVTAMAVDSAQVMEEVSKIKAAKKPIDKESLVPARRYVQMVINQAEELGHGRTIGWATTQKALIHYYADEIVEAFAVQEKACEPRFNPMNWPDRPYNLACLAARIYAGDNRRTDMRKRCVELLEALCASANDTHVKRHLKLAIDDSDLKPLLAIEEELQKRIEAAAK